MNKEYHKIQSVYKRDEKTKRFIPDEWSTSEIEYLHNCKWWWDEKIDGTNIRIHWDGINRKFGGRTDSAMIPATLVSRLEELFPVEKLLEVFGSNVEVILYGEGYGAKIQNGGNYLPYQDFILFDVMIGSWYLERSSIAEIATKLSLSLTPFIGEGTLLEAIEYVRNGFQSKIGTAKAEGLVIRPLVQLFNRKGERILVKVKTKDFIS